ncbi:MAG: phage tail sheath family protein [Cellulomonas sp.]
MSITTTYPGVYITEVPSGSRTLTGVATSITAFVGRAARGPVDEPVPVSSFGDFERLFGGLWRGSGLGYAVRDFFLNGGGQALVVRVVKDALTAGLALDDLTLTATGPGVWANDLTAWVEYPETADATEIAESQGSGVGADDLFTLTLASGGQTEAYVNVTVVEGPRRLDHVLVASALVRVAGALPTARPGERRQEDGVTPYTVALADAGDDGDAPDAASYTSAPNAEANKLGIYALLKADLFNLLVIPPPTPGSEVPVAVWADAASFATRKRAFLIVDPPATETLDTVEAWTKTTAGLAGTDTRNVAVYFPRILRPDPLRGGATDAFVASGAVAGVYARTDASRGVWKAPAGTDAGLSGVVGLTVPLTDDENGRINPLGINALRSFRGIGPVVWGARTLRGSDRLADEYKYVPVRRLALFLEESLYRGTQWVVFEPNDNPLWSQIRTSVGAFMQDLFWRGAFQGASPRDAYFVRCDGETTTQYDIDRGIVNIQVGFAPLKPAEFVIIGIQQKTASVGA